jgi:hypothetical protein
MDIRVTLYPNSVATRFRCPDPTILTVENIKGRVTCSDILIIPPSVKVVELVKNSYGRHTYRDMAVQ